MPHALLNTGPVLLDPVFYSTDKRLTSDVTSDDGHANYTNLTLQPTEMRMFFGNVKQTE